MDRHLSPHNALFISLTPHFLSQKSLHTVSKCLPFCRLPTVRALMPSLYHNAFEPDRNVTEFTINTRKAFPTHTHILLARQQVRYQLPTQLIHKESGTKEKRGEAISGISLVISISTEDCITTTTSQI